MGGLGLRYGHATWIDADGRRRRLKVRHRGGIVELRVPAPLLAASRYPALLDPFISPELGLDNPTNGPANGSQWRPTMAFDGTNFLLAWDDVRLGTDGDIYGARITKAGVVIDKTGIVISDGKGYQGRTSVAYDGTNFLVVWEDYRGTDVNIYGARISKAGAVLDKSGVPISTAAGAQFAPHVSHDGTNFVVFWPDRRGGIDFDLYMARVSAAGVVLDAAGLPVALTTGDVAEPAAVFDGSNILVVWNDHRGSTGKDIYAARVTKAGVVLDTSGVAVCTVSGNQEAPQIAFDGANALAVWYDGRGADKGIYGARISGAGVVLEPNGFVISDATDHQSWPSVKYDGAGYLVAWQDGRSGSSDDIYAARVSTAGAVLDTGGVAISTASGDQTRPYIGFDGTQYMVAWTDDRTGQEDIYTSRVSTAGAVLDPSGLLASKAGNMQLNPAAAYDGTNYLVVWQDNRAGASLDIWGARLSTAAKVLDPAGIAVSTASGDQIDPAVAFDGTNFLVVWRDDRAGSGGSGADIYGARISKAGAVLDASGLAISTASGDQARPAVTHDGTNFLAAWQDGRTAGGSDIYAARISAAGALLDTGGIAVSVAGDDQQRPALAAGGAAALLAWEDKRSGKTLQIYGARINAAGLVLDSAGIPIAQPSLDCRRPAVAHDGADYRVAWHDEQSGGGEDVHSVRVNSGQILDATPLELGTSVDVDSRLALCSDKGGNVLAVWQKYESGGVFGIYGIRVQGKTLLSAGPFKIVGDSWASEGEAGLALSGTGGNQYMLAYTRFDDSVTQRTPRIRARLLTWKSEGATCSDDDDCASGYCVDGVCCDEACGAGSSSDCQACSKAAGAAVDGTCGAVGAGPICRAAAGDCDLAESCNGTDLTCPVDSFKPSSEVCRKAVADCDAAESCTGAAAACPADLFKVDGTVCQGGSGQCSKGTCVPLPDAGPPDLGQDLPPQQPDAGPDPDRGLDSGPVPDQTGSGDAAIDARTRPRQPQIGCTCSTAADAGVLPPLAALALMALFGRARRRRR